MLKMLDCAKVKTYIPIIPAGTGPTFTTIEDAIYEMVSDVSETSGIQHDQDDVKKIVAILIKGLELEDLIDGSYEILKDYTLEVKTIQQWQLDQMPDFNGY